MEGRGEGGGGFCHFGGEVEVVVVCWTCHGLE